VGLQIEHKKYIPLHFEHKKIKNFNEEDYKNLYKYLVKLCQISGVQKPENEALKSVIVFLKETYSDFSKNEIETAFNMAFSYQLEISDLNNYGTLNVIWISKILNAYKLKRDRALIEFEKKRRELEFEKSQEKTQAEIDSYMATATLANFEKYKETKDFSDMGSSIFNTLSRFGLIVLSDDEKIHLMKRARQSILKRSQGEDTGLKRIVTSLTKGTPAEMERYEARDIAVVDLFDKWIEKNVDPKELLKKYL
jgi:hypothetical protein